MLRSKPPLNRVSVSLQCTDAAMPVIATSIEPHRVTRIFFDCRNVPPELLDLRRIEQSVEQSIAMADAIEDSHSQIA